MGSGANNSDSGSVTVRAKDSWQMEKMYNLSRQIHRALGINFCFEIVKLMKLSNESDEEAFTLVDFVKAEKEVLTQWIYHPRELRTLYYRYRDMGNSPLISRMRSRKLSRLIPRSEAPKEETAHIDVLQHIRLRQICYEAEEQWEVRDQALSYYDDDGLQQSLIDVQRQLTEISSDLQRQYQEYPSPAPLIPPPPRPSLTPWWLASPTENNQDDDDDPGDELYYTF